MAPNLVAQGYKGNVANFVTAKIIKMSQNITKMIVFINCSNS